MTDSLLSLLQSAPGPSRELDAEIALANGWTLILDDPECLYRDPTGLYKNLPHYTDDMEAVRRDLLPEDPANPGKPMLWSVSYDEDGVAGSRGYGASLGMGYHDPQPVHGYSEATPALALLIAIMKAKEDSKP